MAAQHSLADHASCPLALEDSLAAALPSLEPLLPAGEARRLIGLARQLPVDVPCAGVECRLHADPQVDFFMGVWPHQAGTLAAHAADSACGQVLARWQSGALARWSDSAWIEFDRDRAGELERLPWHHAYVFFRFAPFLTGEERRALLAQFVAGINGRPERADAACAALQAVLPASAHLLYAAWSQHRGDDETRVVVTLSRAELLRLVRAGAVAVASGAGQITSLLEQAHGVALRAQLSAGSDARPRLHSVELFFAHAAESAPRWRRLFRQLIDQELALEHKVEAALGWPGESHHTRRDGAGSFHVRRLLHVALRVSDTLCAKVYPQLYLQAAC